MNCLKALLITIHSIDQEVIDVAFDSPGWNVKFVRCESFVVDDLISYIDDAYDWIFIDINLDANNFEEFKPDSLMFYLKTSSIQKDCGISILDSSKNSSKDFNVAQYYLHLAKGIYSAYFEPEAVVSGVSDILSSTEYRGILRFQAPVLAKSMSHILANLSKDPDRLGLGLWEMFMNAIEHGNLGIDNEEKRRHVNNRNIDDLVQEKLRLPENKNKFVSVSYIVTAKRAIFDIKDEGNGFDWLKFWDIDHSRMFDKCGRGIALARMMAFDHIAYLGSGNNVICSIDFNQDVSI